jgi:N-acetylglutamate synthase-like GNAT family acetyltransferase
MNHRSYLLELASTSDFRPKAFPDSTIIVVRATTSEAKSCKHLWDEVGHEFWSEREDWTLERWRTYLSQGIVSFWIAERGTEAIGFFELSMVNTDMKIEGLGILPQWRNKGFGGGLLSAATQQAFDCGARRIWLHTATDDHPNALPNYTKRGYRIYHEEVLKNPMPDKLLEPRVNSVA